MMPFSVTLRSEWTKLASLRGTWIKLAIAFVLSVGLTALLALIIGATWDDASAADRASHDPAGIGLLGSLFSMIVFAVIGATAVTSEYGSGMMRITLTATPRRGRVLAAKAAVIAAVTLVAGLVTATTTFVVAQLVLASYGVPAASLGDDDALRTVLADAALTPVLPVIAVALGFATRSTAGAITSVLGVVFLPWILGGVLPRWWRENALDYLPGAASEAITSGHLETATEGLLAPGAAALVLLGWLALFLGAAWLVLERRDA
jgi:ABC-2 type transport system permease protein